MRSVGPPGPTVGGTIFRLELAERGQLEWFSNSK